MDTYDRGGKQLELGKPVIIDITNYARMFMPYGMYGNMPVIISDIGDRRRTAPRYEVQPGDTVIANAYQFSNGCAFARVVERRGVFISDGDRGAVRLTGLAKADARDSISSPEDSGGFMGVFTIVKSVKPEDPNGSGKPRECYIRVQKLLSGKHNRHFVLGRPVRSRDSRVLEREMYVAEWPPPPSVELPESYTDSTMVPNLEMLYSAKIGIPQEANGMLFFGDGGFKVIASRGGDREVISDMHPIDAVDKYCRRYSGRHFRLGLASPGSIRQLKGAIEDSDFDIHAESLCI